jgi:hypothetical protein
MQLGTMASERLAGGRRVGMMIAAIDAVARELMLFAAAGFLVGGLDDLLVDAVWILRRLRARFAPDVVLADLPRPPRPMRFAIFVAAWREQAVIGPMLRAAVVGHGTGKSTTRDLAGRCGTMWAEKSLTTAIERRLHSLCTICGTLRRSLPSSDLAVAASAS